MPWPPVPPNLSSRPLLPCHRRPLRSQRVSPCQAWTPLPALLPTLLFPSIPAWHTCPPETPVLVAMSSRRHGPLLAGDHPGSHLLLLCHSASLEPLALPQRPQPQETPSWPPPGCGAHDTSMWPWVAGSALAGPAPSVKRHPFHVPSTGSVRPPTCSCPHPLSKGAAL